MSPGRGYSSHDCAEVSSSRENTGTEVCSPYHQQMRAFNRPPRLLIPAEGCDRDDDIDQAGLDGQAGRGRALQGSSSCCSEASFCSHLTAEQHRANQQYSASPVLLGPLSPATRCLFDGVDDSHGLQKQAASSCAQYSPAGVTTPSISAADQLHRRKGIEQWLSRMEDRVVRKDSLTSSAGTAAAAGLVVAAAPNVPQMPSAELPAPAFVLMGLLSSPS